MTTALQPARRARDTLRGPALKVRYGRNDFDEFNQDEAKGHQLLVGQGKIGKVDVDCKYSWSEAKWGTLERKNAAGIVYMDISFKQTHGYWLETASVFVTISEGTEDYALREPSRRERKTSPNTTADYAVQIREYFGPECLVGPTTTAEKVVQKSATPAVGAMGLVDLGGMGRDSTTSSTMTDCWVFRGQRGAPLGRKGLRTLQWELKENHMAPGRVHNQEYHTAFAFEHSQRPVYMRVEISGTLSSKTQQFRHKCAKFSSAFSKQDSSTLTRIDLGGDVDWTESLDEEAKRLRKAMTYKNISRTPVELPKPATASLATDETLVNDSQGTQAESVEEAGTSRQAHELIDMFRNQLLREMGRSDIGIRAEARAQRTVILESSILENSFPPSRIAAAERMEPRRPLSPGYRGSQQDVTPEPQPLNVVLLPARMLVALFQLLREYVLSSALAISLALLEREGRIVNDSPKINSIAGDSIPRRRMRPAIDAPEINILPPQTGFAAGAENRVFLRQTTPSSRRGNSW